MIDKLKGCHQWSPQLRLSSSMPISRRQPTKYLRRCENWPNRLLGSMFNNRNLLVPINNLFNRKLLILRERTRDQMRPLIQ